MARLLVRDYQNMLDLVVTALADLDADGLVWQHLCTDLAGTLHASLTGVFEVCWPRGVARRLDVWPAWAARISLPPEQTAAHPLVRHYGSRADPVPRTLADVPDVLGWHRSGRYAEARAQFRRADQQLAIPLGSPFGVVRFVGLGRPGRNFTPREMEYVRRLQPLLQALDRHQGAVRRRPPMPATVRADVEDLGITPRELAVLALLAEGRSPGEIGRRLGISGRTVDKHQENLQRKLGTPDRLTTVLRAQQLRIVHPPDDQRRNSAGGSSGSAAG